MHRRIKLNLLFGLLCWCSFSLSTTQAQVTEIISLSNPSFEDEPQAGLQPAGWSDCGSPGETPPDVQPFGGFNVVKGPQDGNTYLGLVTRDNETWEAIAQRLEQPIRPAMCYHMSMFLARSARYLSPTKRSRGRPVSFTTPVKVRIWGGSSSCDRKELLAESPLISNENWKSYTLRFTPKQAHRYIILEAYYKTPSLFPYNGNVLVDNLSAITPCDMPLDASNPPLAVNEPQETPRNERPIPRATRQDPFSSKGNKPKRANSTIPKKNKGAFSEDVDVRTLRKGDTYQLESIYFQADSASIPEAARAELVELYQFLKANPSIEIEVGGHTNGIPPDAFCDRLSEARALSVAEFLVGQGVNAKRISYKGYGKREPIATNSTKEGRRRNQRVEIKFTDL